MTAISLSTKQKYGTLLAGNPAGGDSSYWLISKTTVGSGGSATVEFTSIPSTYTHLQIRGLTRISYSGTTAYALCQFNSDTTQNYNDHELYANGLTVTANNQGNINQFYVNYLVADAVTSNVFSGFVMDILDYKDTNKYKTVRTLDGFDANGSGFLCFQSGLWRSTSAITSLKFTASSSTNFMQYSSFALYGIKGA